MTLKTSPIITHAPDDKALDIQLTNTSVWDTVELADGVYFGIDADGQAVGIEILNVDEALLSSVAVLPATATLRDLLPPPTSR